MRLPPESLLLAASRWLELLPSSGGIPRAQALLTTHSQFSDLSPNQYATALSWLRSKDLLEGSASQTSVAERILSAILESSAPTWVQDADQLVTSPDELPLDIVAAGTTLGIDANGVYEQVVRSWGKVDTAYRERVGAAGEEALVAILEEVTWGKVDHVSTLSDGFGYDIAFSDRGISAHLEVKSTTRTGRFTAYLSRHECSVMLRDDRWLMVAVRLDAKLAIAGVGSVPKHWIASNVPRDCGPYGSWASCKLEIPSEVIRHQVLELGANIADRLPAWTNIS